MPDDDELAPPDEDLPPVVARMVIEVRSDGSRTIARGGLEDVTTGKKVTVDARGSSPAALALALARQIFKMPSVAAVRGLLASRKK
jgi:hypothetical protein